MTSIAYAAMYFAVTSVVVILATFIFDLLTRHNSMEEINKGNMAVAFSTGGMMFGVANIMHFALLGNDKLLKALLWGGVGTAALIIVYFAFEVLTPKLNVNEEICKGNNAVGFISFILSVAFSFVIGASIS
jgi:putative membrane protein